MLGGRGVRVVTSCHLDFDGETVFGPETGEFAGGVVLIIPFEVLVLANASPGCFVFVETEWGGRVEKAFETDQVTHPTVRMAGEVKYVDMVMSRRMYIPRRWISVMTSRKSSIVPRWGSRRVVSSGYVRQFLERYTE